MERHAFQHDGLTLSYLDNKARGPALIALHAHWMQASTFAALGEALAPAWRVIALDQRGHGYSDHVPSATRDDYLWDLNALLQHLALRDVVLLGNSLGGVNAYQFAARHPALVRALIVEDIGAELHDDISFVLAWEGTFPTQAALEERIGERLAPYLRESIRETAAGFRLAFEPRDQVISQKHLNGDHWSDWLASDCPALLLRGSDSRLTNADHFEQMAQRRPNTLLETLMGGHVLHMDNPRHFTRSVKRFLDGLPQGVEAR